MRFNEVKKFIISEEGQGLIEYMLIISLVAIVAIVGLTIFGLTVKNFYTNTVNGVAAPLG